MEELDAESSEMVEEEFNSRIEQGKSLSERFREELESYLTELEAKVSADGESLVSKPDNFDAIVNSMTREDLLDKTSIGGQPTWYDSMIQDHVSKKLDRDFHGRYHHVFSDSRDQKIRKGMAEILMLDRQLYQITKKAQQMANENIIGPAESIPTTPGSVSSRQDRTFMTKHKTDDECFATSESSRKPSSDNQSPRRQPSPPRSAKKSGRKVAFQPPDDIKMTKEQQQRRIEELLSMDDLTYESSLAYLDQEYLRDLQEIDETLAQFGHLDRLTPKEEPEKDDPPQRDDYLAQRRQERKIEEYTSRIDSLLSKTKASDTDYSLLLHPNNDAPSRSSIRQALHEVPTDVNDIRPDLPITRNDIQVLLANLSQQVHEATASRSQLDDMMKEYEADMLRLQRLRATQRHDEEMKRVMDSTSASSSRLSTAQHQQQDEGRPLEDVSLLSLDENPFSGYDSYRQQAKDESEDDDEKYFKQQQKKKHQQQNNYANESQLSSSLLFSSADRQALQQQLEQEEQQLMSMVWLRRPVPPPPLQQLQQQQPPRSREKEELILPPIQQPQQILQQQQLASQPYQPLNSNRRVKQPKQQVSPRTRRQQEVSEPTVTAVGEADFEELPSPQEQLQIQKQVLLDQVRRFVEC